MLESLEQGLRGLGATKVRKVKQRSCIILVVEIGGGVYLITINERGLTDNHVGKVVPSTKVLNWSCSELNYSPYGLYVLADNEEEFISKVIRKLQLIMKAY